MPIQQGQYQAPDLPSVYATIGNADEQFGQMIVPGLFWLTVAEDLQDDDSEVSGRYIEPTGEIHGVATALRQDTYLAGTMRPDGSAFAGRAFVASGGGVWNPQNDANAGGVWLLNQPNGGLDNTNTPTLTSATPTTGGIEHAEIILSRGWNPIDTTGTVYSPANIYAYLYFAWGSPDGIDYRLAYERGNPPGLDRTTDSWQTWTRVKQQRRIASIERYHRGESYQMQIAVKPDYDHGRIVFEMDDSNWLVDAPKIPPGADPSSALPSVGNIRLETKNGSTRFGYFPVRHEDVSVAKTGAYLLPGHDANAAITLVNTQIDGDGQTTTNADVTPSPDGTQIALQVTASRSDAGEGKGSAAPPKVASVAVIIPSEFTFELDPAAIGRVPDFGILKSKGLHTLEVLDEATRTIYTSGVLICSNAKNFYTQSYGRVAISVAVASDAGQYAGGPYQTGGAYSTLCTGYAGDGAEGVVFSSGADELDLMRLPFSDKMPALQAAIVDECSFDGWGWKNAVQYVATQKCNVHPRYIGFDVATPPGQRPELPYGEAGPETDYYVLPKGLGSRPLTNYLPFETGYSIIQPMVAGQVEVDAITGAQYPYYWGFDSPGNLRLEAFDFVNAAPVCIFADDGSSGTFPILNRIEVYNSVLQMRTDIHFLTVDNRTGELLYYYLPMPNRVKRAVGLYSPWLEHSARFGNEAGLIQAANSAAIQAGLPQQTARFLAPNVPWFRVGMKALVYAKPLGGVVEMTATTIQRSVGMVNPGSGSPVMRSLMTLEMRNSLNFAM